MSSKLAVPEQEFALLPELAESLGLPGPDPHRVQRRWVTVVSGGHVSGVTWDTGPAEIVLLHEARRSARSWDRVLLALGRPALALDLPGHGRSGWRGNGVYSPRRLAPAVSEAIRSFAPTSKVVAGAGLGALTAIALTARSPDLVRALVLVDTLPGTSGEPGVVGPPHLPGGGARPAQGGQARRRRGGPGRRRPLRARRGVRRDVDLAPPPGKPARRGGGAPRRRDPLGAAGGPRRIRGARPARPPATGGRLSEASAGELARRVPSARLVTVEDPADLAGVLREVLDTIQGRTA